MIRLAKKKEQRAKHSDSYKRGGEGAFRETRHLKRYGERGWIGSSLIEIETFGDPENRST